MPGDRRGLATKSAAALAAVKAVLAAREPQLSHVATPLTAAMFTTSDTQRRIESFRSQRSEAGAVAG